MLSKIIIKPEDEHYYIFDENGKIISQNLDSMYFEEEKIVFVCKKDIGVYKKGDLCIFYSNGKSKEVHFK